VPMPRKTFDNSTAAERELIVYMWIYTIYIHWNPHSLPKPYDGGRGGNQVNEAKTNIGKSFPIFDCQLWGIFFRFMQLAGGIRESFCAIWIRVFVSISLSISPPFSHTPLYDFATMQNNFLNFI